MVGDEALLLLGHDGALLLRAGHDALQGVADLLLADLLEVAPCRQDGRLVHQVLQIRAGEACTQWAASIRMLSHPLSVVTCSLKGSSLHCQDVYIAIQHLHGNACHGKTCCHGLHRGLLLVHHQAGKAVSRSVSATETTAASR